MNKHREIAWSRLLVEGAAIVVSILLAFWIDAWWDGIKDRQEEREILVGLEVEFVDLKERLDFWAQRNLRGMQQIEQYLSDSVAEMDLRSIESALASATSVNVLDQGGAIDSLLASGRLERIGDSDIRARLVKWPDWLEDIHTNDLSTTSFVISQIQPFLAKRGFPQTVCPDGGLVCSEPGPVPPAYLEMAKNPQFRAMLIMRRGWMGNAARDHENGRNEAMEILTMIRARLSILDT